MSVPPLRELLRDAVAIPSPSGREATVADWALGVLRTAGVEARRVGDSVVARVEGSGRGPHLFLNSHLDTVPAGDGWERDPWDVEWADGRLVGLGANDAKASAMAMAWALMRFAAEGARPPGTVTLALTACEETNNAGMNAVLAEIGADLDGAVTGEPTGLEVVRAQSGLAVLEARWSGRSCHAAHVARVDNVNALALAAADLARFGSHVALPGEHELLGASTLAATVFTSGERHNVVPGAALAVFDARLAPGHDAAECAALLRERLPRAEVSVRSDRLRPRETPADHPIVRAALRAARRERAIGSSTMSDMALLAGVPAVKCGPGETARSHTPNEFVLEAELEAGGAFYRELIPLALDALAAPSALASGRGVERGR